MYFGSDNQTGASDQVFDFMQQANKGITGAYASDEWTQRAVEDIQRVFECDAAVHFVSTGTAANSLALSCMARPWDSIICHGQAHIINDELTAPEFFTGGARLVGLDTQRATLSSESLANYLAQGSAHPPHNAVPAVLSLTQLNESGQAYTKAQITDLCRIAHEADLTVHMDGARFANAIVSLNCSPADITWRAGVDVLCLGATKNGALSAEAVIFFNKSLERTFIQQRKRSGHLISKSRWLGAQFVGWLHKDHWLDLAKHANLMAKKLEAGLQQSKQCQTVWSAEGNELFVVIPNALIKRLREEGAIFYEWPKSFLEPSLSIDDNHDVVRLVTSFRTTEAEVEQFIRLL